MCGRYSISADISKLAEGLGIPPSEIPEFRPRYNIAPQSAVPAIIRERAKAPQIRFFSWGLIPPWAKDPSIAQKWINARQETLAERPSFRGPFRNSRCLIPADGFYEWKREGQTKTPYYVRMKSREMFAFAGLWSHWIGADGSEIPTCTIITGEPNELVRPLHARMPVILDPERSRLWLDPERFLPQDLMPLLAPFPAEKMESYLVRSLVNTPRHDSPECILPA